MVIVVFVSSGFSGVVKVAPVLIVLGDGGAFNNCYGAQLLHAGDDHVSPVLGSEHGEE